MVLGMVRAGLFGELTHAEGAYIHDLREVLFDDHEGLWRRDEHFSRNGNLYPTHGLGPVANYLDINRGDRFETLVSMSSIERGLSARRDRLPAGDPRRKETYACGDMNTSILRTARGRTVLLQHDVVTPRPYSRINHVQGTKGAFRDYPAGIFLDGQKGEEWGPLKPYRQRFDHPLWKRLREVAQQERPRRHGLRDELAADAVPPRGPGPGHGRLRRRRLERARSAVRAVGEGRQRRGGLPRLHARALEGAAGVRAGRCSGGAGRTS